MVAEISLSIFQNRVREANTFRPFVVTPCTNAPLCILVIIWYSIWFQRFEQIFWFEKLAPSFLIWKSYHTITENIQTTRIASDASAAICKRAENIEIVQAQSSQVVHQRTGDFIKRFLVPWDVHVLQWMLFCKTCVIARISTVFLFHRGVVKNVLFCAFKNYYICIP